MLTLIVPPSDAIRLWDEQNEVFYTKPPFKGGILKLEHSLISVSKWESKWCKPFIDSKKTNDEVYDYIRCMALNVNESDPIFDYLSTENHEAINKYLERPMTATTLPKERGTSKKIITSEVIYYWMLELGIPFECEKLNFQDADKSLSSLSDSAKRVDMSTLANSVQKVHRQLQRVKSN